MKRLLVALLLLPSMAGAGALSDLLMSPGGFGDAPDGPLLAYREQRSVPAESGLQPLDDGRLTVARVEGTNGPALAVAREVDGKAQPVAEVSVGGANPVLLYFLEATVRDLSQATGGNPYYIRNRMREALVAADLGPASVPRDVTLSPFAADRNRARLGSYADLTLRLRFDEDRPGDLLELSSDTAEAGEGYHHRLTLIAED